MTERNESHKGAGRARRIGYGIGGFSLGLATVGLTAFTLHLFVSVAWTTSTSFLAAFAAALGITITVIAASWVCLLKGLTNRAMIRGVWWQIYLVIAAAVVVLIVFLHP